MGVSLATLGSALSPVSATGLGPPRPYAATRRVRTASCSSTTSGPA